MSRCKIVLAHDTILSGIHSNTGVNVLHAHTLEAERNLLKQSAHTSDDDKFNSGLVSRFEASLGRHNRFDMNIINIIL